MYKNNAYIRLHTSILLAGATGLFGRLISISELPLVCIRVILATIILGAILYRKIRHVRIPLKALLQIMGCGILLSLHWVLYYGSIKASNVSIGAVCFALVGFFTAIMEPLFNRRPPSWKELSLSILTVVGIALIFGMDAQYRTGISIGILSSFVYSLFSISSKKVQARTNQKSSTMLFYEFIGGAIVLMLLLPPYSLLFPSASLFPTWSDAGYLILFASVFTIAPFLLLLQALRSISAFTVNLSYNLEPVYTILLAMIIFNEARELNHSFWIGILLVILSVILQAINNHKKQHNTPQL